MSKKIGILGSTGSIGTQTLQVVRELNSRPETADNPHIEITLLSAGSKKEMLAEQAIEFRVQNLCIGSREDALWLKERLSGEIPGLNVFFGSEGLKEAASLDMDVLVTAIVGMRGLEPTLAAIKNHTDIALANKETLVAAGDIVMKTAKENGVKILPVDSEHSAVFQSLESSYRGGHDALEKIILTASGGPFRGYTKEQLKEVSLDQALNHPTWRMGGKITVDCASMMNKGLEVIEAMHLFDVSVDDIDVAVHPQSIVHSMVRFKDGSVIAQLGLPDMKVPIQLALTYPYRTKSETPRLDLREIGKLTFEKPDTDVFRCLALAYSAAKVRGSLPAVMNGANEQAVDAYLKRKISFTRIGETVEKVMEEHSKNGVVSNPDLSCILELDAWAKSEVRRILCI